MPPRNNACKRPKTRTTESNVSSNSGSSTEVPLIALHTRTPLAALLHSARNENLESSFACSREKASSMDVYAHADVRQLLLAEKEAARLIVHIAQG